MEMESMYPDRLKPNERLTSGRELRSSDGQHRLVMQNDGNLVVYGPSGARWTPPGMPSTGERLILQEGNLVVYNASGTALWWIGFYAPPASAPAPTASPAPTDCSKRSPRSLSSRPSSSRGSASTGASRTRSAG
ncbi:hypothetical protein F0U59_47225 [Archangium gephyra]|nr:hypothetical protein F0U59_47225 [Archangium gephyra]